MASVFKFLLALQLLLARPASITWILLATRNFHSPLASWRAVVSHTVLVRVVLSLQVTILAIYSSYNTCCQTNLSVRIFNYLCKTIEHHIDTIKHWQELLDHQYSCKILHQNWLSMIISEELLLMKKFSKT